MAENNTPAIVAGPVVTKYSGDDKIYFKSFEYQGRVITLCLAKKEELIKFHWFLYPIDLRQSNFGKVRMLDSEYVYGYAVMAPGDTKSEELGMTISEGRAKKEEVVILSTNMKMDKKFAGSILDKLFYEFKNSKLKEIIERNGR